MVLLPCGMALLTKVSQTCAQHEKDIGLGLEHESLCKFVSQTSVPDRQEFVGEGDGAIVKLPNKKNMIDILKQQTNIIGNCSDQFKRRRAEDLGAVSALQDKYKSLLIDVAESIVMKQLCSAFILLLYILFIVVSFVCVCVCVCCLVHVFGCC